jgi:hypothetical protein
MKIEVANGEIVDKFTILSIKLERISDRAKQQHIRTEHAVLEAALTDLKIVADDPDVIALLKVNRRLWDIEDRIRSKEAQSQFDAEFIELARSVYIQNDLRADLKRKINLKTNSGLIEEKSYPSYERKSSSPDKRHTGSGSL